MYQLLVPDRDIIVQMSFPSAYPVKAPRILSVSSKLYPHASKEVFEDMLASVFTPEFVCMFEYIEVIRETYEEPEEAEDLQVQDEEIDDRDLEQHIVNAWTPSKPLVDRKSTFIGFAAKIGSAQDFRDLLALLKEDKHIARATHNITAYRIKNDNGTVIQDCDDDGETAAGSRLLHLLAVSLHGN